MSAFDPIVARVAGCYYVLEYEPREAVWFENLGPFKSADDAEVARDRRAEGDPEDVEWAVEVLRDHGSEDDPIVYIPTGEETTPTQLEWKLGPDLAENVRISFFAKVEGKLQKKLGTLLDMVRDRREG